MSIKKGDLVMVVKPAPCCGNDSAIGMTFTVSAVGNWTVLCIHCLAFIPGHAAETPLGSGYLLSRLKKIDPPAVDDSLPTRADIEVAA